MKNEKKTQVTNQTLNVRYDAIRAYKKLKQIREQGLDTGMFYMLFELYRLYYFTSYSCSGHDHPERFYISMYINSNTYFEKDDTGHIKPVETKEDIVPIEKLDKSISLICLEKAAEGLFKIEEEPCFSLFINNEFYCIVSLDEENIDIYFKVKDVLLEDKEHESLVQFPAINVCIRVLDEMRDSITFNRIVENFNEMIRRLKKMWNRY